MRVFECTSKQRKFKEMRSKCNSYSIIIVDYNINNKNNGNNTNKVITVVKMEQ